MSARGLCDGFPVAGQMAVLEHMRSGAVTTPGLAIAAAGNAAAKASAFSYRIDGKIHDKTAQATIALTNLGSLGTKSSGAAFLSINANGDVAVEAVTTDEAGAIRVPEPEAGYCLFGAVQVATSNATFTGGTTALDASGITTTYHNLSGMIPGEPL